MNHEATNSSHEKASGAANGRRGRTGTTYAGTKAAVRNAYGTTSEALQAGYARTIEYGNEHPQRFGLLTFAAGLGAGTLLAMSRLASRHMRTERIASPVIDVVAEIARAFGRR